MRASFSPQKYSFTSVLFDNEWHIRSSILRLHKNDIVRIIMNMLDALERWKLWK